MPSTSEQIVTFRRLSHVSLNDCVPLVSRFFLNPPEGGWI